ncbi:MAG TPA: chromosome segregation protein SMC [Chloroflexi bacterium]|nr:chromosome segregation protein SMC [Chloroflexota bacterium]
MHLKKLELYGYKSFALKTELVFDSGITAIVGPNGSGKSNLVDAIRWILGEQSYKVLRGKSTEDMIFAGSAQRPRMGMAYGTITLDNSDGKIPLDFSEITITRRAYRSGENEYFINGDRVRLKDINELMNRAGLSHLTYAFIGQGLVDAALSLRPQERRILLEEAAGIAPYRDKRRKALQEMEETQRNLIRLKDILAEITPRLEKLREQSRKAEEYLRLSQDLKELLRIWYGHQWYLRTKALKKASQEEKKIHGLLEEARCALEESQNLLQKIRARKSEVQGTLASLRRKISVEERELSQLDREIAVLEERIAYLKQREEELKADLEAKERHRAQLSEKLAQVKRELADLEAQAEAKRELWAKAEKISTEALDQKIRALRAEVAEIESKLATIRRKRLGIEAEGERIHRQLALTSERLEKARADEKWLLEKREAEIKEVTHREQKLKEELEQLEEEERGLKAELSRTLGRQEAIKARLQASDDLLSSKEPPLLSGNLRGPLARLIKAPEGLEKALEVALTPFLDGWVVESFGEAVEALGGSPPDGHHILFPLDSLRELPPLALPDSEEVMGIALELVECAEELTPLVKLLLGRTVIVKDLETAKRVMELLRGEELPCQVVTLNGELLHNYGMVERMHNRKGLMELERERRQWETELVQLSEEEEDLRNRLDERERRRRELEEKLREERGKKAALEASYTARRSEIEAQIRGMEEEIKWQKSRLASLEEERSSLVKEETVLLSALEVKRSKLSELEAALESLGPQEELPAIQAELKLWQERRENLDHRRKLLENDLQKAEEEHHKLQGKLQDTTLRLAKALDDLSRLQERRDGKALHYERLLAEAEEKERLLATLDKEEQEALMKREESQSQVNRYEILLDQAKLNKERTRDELISLRKRIQEEFGLVEIQAQDAISTQRPLPLRTLASTLPLLETIPPNLEEEIKHLKGQLKRLGTVNLEAPEEYKALEERYSLLKEQIEDLEKGLARLRRMIADLDKEMEKRFMSTFKAVDAAFRLYFKELFLGGTARLILTNSKDWEEAGIEIEANPPGKRHKRLAMLSGGERALTAVALLFAILKVKPVPFCVLDEVDAMLDEANVGRFCKVLKELSKRIQFIVITHNRGTVEASDTLYGVSIGEDGVSQVISLKIEKPGPGLKAPA